MAGAARGRGGANAAEKAARIGASRAGGRPAPGGPANAPRAAWPVRSLRNAFFDHRGRRASVRSSDEGKAWALEMRIRAERRALDERQAQARQRQQDAAQARLEKARAEAMKAQQVERQQRALREAQERLKKGGLLYRVSGQAKHDREAQAELPERLKRSMEQVNGWVERERRGVAQDAEALAHRQQTERAELERKIEDARKLGEWREREPSHAPGRETGERHEHGRGLGGGRGRS